MHDGIKTLARILRVDEALLESTVGTMEKITLKKGVIDDIVMENERTIKEALLSLGKENASAQDITKALEDSLAHDDAALFTILGQPDLWNPEQSAVMVQKAYDAVGGKAMGLFLKHEKAREMLMQTPPPSIIRGFGYQSVDELLQKERLEEIFAALRFIETREWMNEVFVKHYETLTPQDFEERPLELIVLQHKWLALAEKFVEKKYHNVSHLKELGVIFVIPIKLDTVGETIRLFSLLLHYLHEVPFYAKLIKQYAQDQASFAAKLMSLIRGDVGDMIPETSDHFVRWLIVQRYLAKDDPQDKRLFLPRVNPEAIHWRKAQKALVSFAHAYPELKLTMFGNLDCIGNFFPSKDQGEMLVSFDLVDNVMGLVKREDTKYLYHQQEALWNRIFAGFMGEEQMEQLILEHLDEGFIELTL